MVGYLGENCNGGGLVRIWNCLLHPKTFTPAMLLELIFTKDVLGADPPEVKSPHNQMSLTSPDHHLVFQNFEESKSKATYFTSFNPNFINVFDHRTLLLQNF